MDQDAIQKQELLRWWRPTAIYSIDRKNFCSIGSRLMPQIIAKMWNFEFALDTALS
jgi:hypothetical protein